MDGFESGAFLLRSDGVLLRRHGYSIGAAADMRWKFMQWKVKDAAAGTDAAKVSARLIGEGYGLYKPSPVPLSVSTAGPFPGYPDRAENADGLS